MSRFRCCQTVLAAALWRSEEHTSELQPPCNLVCRLLLEKKKINNYILTRLHHIVNQLDDELCHEFVVHNIHDTMLHSMFNVLHSLTTVLLEPQHDHLIVT